jgi:hypothetical protein
MGTKFLALFRCFNIKRLLSLSFVALLFAVAVWALTAPSTIFEIDGDSATGFTYGAPNSINCDWDTLNAGKTADSLTPTNVCTSGGTTFGSYGFLVGAPGEPNFSGGGSKDGNDISAGGVTKGVWAFTSTSTPDKDTLTHGFAASYTGPAAQGGDNLLVFGADRFANNGDSNIGIWFFQDNVSIPSGASKGTFSGHHVIGDILIISAFTGGGGTSTISVYQWRPDICTASHYAGLTSGQTGCADTNLNALLVDLSPGGVPTCTASTAACAVVNNQTITLGWPYLTKFGGGAASAPAGVYYEGGIDLTALLPPGTSAPCFSSFLFETRSSQSTSAVLKDFLVGSFPECHLSVNKTVTCNSFNADNTFNYSYSGTVINDGGGTLFNVKVADATTNQNYTCGSLVKGASKVFGGVPLSGDCTVDSGNATFSTGDHPASNVVNASADTSSGGGTPAVTASFTATSSDASATSCKPNPNIEVHKRCVTAFQLSGSTIQVRVDYTGEVVNTGQLNLTNVHVVDDADNHNFGGFSLIPGQAICYTNGQTVNPAATPPTGCPTLSVTTGLTASGPVGSTSYLPGSAGNPLGLGAGRIQFTDTVSATGTASNGSSVGPATDTATCVICPLGSCPN